ncbi:corepressor interacting with RBPJ 1 [Aphis craccivora]|uniref:Corepressor interacting with RBPJ 1 n=1 Tax=Aphis craccivora TaxID=307492 RepID=A0A6G0Y140_APHCR|nr:corepressor interacting with RBPJ 1 [Aphis craccivora]
MLLNVTIFIYNYANNLQVWMAEQKSVKDKKRQEELRLQYEKEQDLYNNKALLSKESKDKLSVNFMYEPPPGAKKEREREDNEPEYKFEWQRKFNAPREDYCKGDQEIRDQPFGIQVRNVRCIKCHKWGHINTDKECPLFNQASISEAVMVTSNGTSANKKTQELIKQMREDGLELKKSAATTQQQISFANNGEDSDTELFMYVKTLSRKKKMKLLKRLDRMDKIMMKEQKLISKKEKLFRKQNKKKKESSSSSDSSD